MFEVAGFVLLDQSLRSEEVSSRFFIGRCCKLYLFLEFLSRHSPCGCNACSNVSFRLVELMSVMVVMMEKYSCLVEPPRDLFCDMLEWNWTAHFVLLVFA